MFSPGTRYRWRIRSSPSPVLTRPPRGVHYRYLHRCPVPSSWQIRNFNATILELVFGIR
jgi:hypothetical protein